MAGLIDGRECYCCKGMCADLPSFELDTCGWSLNLSGFDASLLASVPATASKMLWLKSVALKVRNATATVETLCAGAGSNWSAKQVITRTGFYQYGLKDPSDDCAETIEAVGAETRVNDNRVDGCATPPDNSLSSFDHWTGTWSFDDSAGHHHAHLDYSGTDENGPISGTTTSNLYSTASEMTTDAWVLETAGVKVLGVRERAWNAVEGDKHYYGSDDRAVGMMDPADYAYTVHVPTHAEVKYMEVEWTVFFTPEGGSESSVATRSVSWADGDASREFDFAETYGDFGTFRLGNVRFRCNPVGFWEELEDQLDTSL